MSHPARAEGLVNTHTHRHTHTRTHANIYIYRYNIATYKNMYKNYDVCIFTCQRVEMIYLSKSFARKNKNI